jgi:hypothetical protein
LFKGLPNDQCQCEHLGYVIKRKLAFRSAEGEETFEAGDAYSAGPGHTPILYAGTEVVEFSPTEHLGQTSEVVTKNMEQMQAASSLNGCPGAGQCGRPGSARCGTGLRQAATRDRDRGRRAVESGFAVEPGSPWKPAWVLNAFGVAGHPFRARGVGQPVDDD